MCKGRESLNTENSFILEFRILMYIKLRITYIKGISTRRIFSFLHVFDNAFNCPRYHATYVTRCEHIKGDYITPRVVSNKT